MAEISSTDSSLISQLIKYCCSETAVLFIHENIRHSYVYADVDLCPTVLHFVVHSPLTYDIAQHLLALVVQWDRQMILVSRPF